MNRSKNIPDKATPWYMLAWNRISPKLPVKGFFYLLLAVILLAVLACYNFSPKAYVLQEGDIAPFDVTAGRSLTIADTKATEKKREEVRQQQPLVCDLVILPAELLRNDVQELFIAINQAETPEDIEELRVRLSQTSGIDVSTETIKIFSDAKVQDVTLNELVPLIQQRLSLGVLSEMRTALPYKGGILVRDLATGEETLHTELDAIQDVKSVEAFISQKVSSIPGSSANRRIVARLLTYLLQPTLIPNYSATAERTEAVVAAVVPVSHRVDKDEIVVRQGEKVSYDQQLKVQTLWRQQAVNFDISLFLGIVIFGSILASGLLFSISSAPIDVFRDRDFLFIGFILIIVSLVAKGLFVVGEELDQAAMMFSLSSLVYAVPVAGATALSALVFSTRRCVIISLLLAFFCTVMVRGGVSLFLFYFLTSMWSTWLTVRTENRHEVVKAVIPMFIGSFAIWFGSSLLNGSPLGSTLVPEAVAVALGVLLSITLTIALAAFIETVFQYTTRFHLMELLNMEQPLLQELMLKAPGTYHHSLIVSNMVEAGAKAVGAHSLLCKVAALYHDVGKISKANYFIENQAQGDNPHDKLTPSMSALILTSHVKRGAELAEEYKLGKEVIDIIQQHHGTGVIRYFYHKALNQKDGPPPNKEDFCYTGPKPLSKEAGVVMLADVIEASSRSLLDPTHTKIQLHIDAVIKGFYAEGQLDQTDLTFRDLNKLAESFQSVLRGLFHNRIVYPEQTATDTVENTKELNSSARVEKANDTVPVS